MRPILTRRTRTENWRHISCLRWCGVTKLMFSLFMRIFMDSWGHRGAGGGTRWSGCCLTARAEQIQPAFRTWPNRLSKQGRLTVPFAVWIIHYCRLAEYAAQVEEGGVGTTTPAHSPLPVNIRLVACCLSKSPHEAVIQHVIRGTCSIPQQCGVSRNEAKNDHPNITSREFAHRPPRHRNPLLPSTLSFFGFRYCRQSIIGFIYF